MAAIAGRPRARVEQAPPRAAPRPIFQRERAIVGLLAAVTVASRLPFLTPRLAHWDAVNYALGLHDFNVAAHQPHPPGSPYFILLGRAALAITGDDNAALILVSLVASAGAVLSEYALARLLFGRSAALLAAIVLLSQPVFWGYGTMATAWTVLACLAIAIGLVCARMIHRPRASKIVIPSALLLGFASGFRLDVTVFLGPLWLFAVWRAEPDPRRRLFAIALVGAGVLVWLVPVADHSGGFDAWWERLVALLPSTGAVASQLATNTAISFGTLGFTLGPALVLAAVSDWRKTLAFVRGCVQPFWVLWIAPAFVFLWLVDSTEPGHDLIFVGALCALGAAAIAHAAHRPTHTLIPGGLLVAAQAMVFVYAAPIYGRPLAWTADAMLLNVTAPGLRQQQESLEAALRIVRTRLDPADTLVVTLTDQDPYRFMMYYLPEYTVVRLDRRADRVLVARDRRQSHWQPASGCPLATDDAPERNAVWVVSAWSDVGLVSAGAQRAESVDAAPFQVWTQPIPADATEYAGITLRRGCGAAS